MSRGATRCRSCGTPTDGAVHLDLILPAGERVPLDRPLTIGRAPACDLRLGDPSVSRAHARILLDSERPALEDDRSSYGTFVDGKRVAGTIELRAGMSIELGDSRLQVAERGDPSAAGQTVSVPAGISLIVAQPSSRRARLRGQQNRKPRMRSGWSLKRVTESEFILKDLRSSQLVALGEPEAQLVGLLDGDHELVELIGEAAQRFGPDGPARLARLLAELADRGLLAGVEEGADRNRSSSRLLRWLAPRERELPGIGHAIAALYRRGGWLLFTPPALALLAASAVLGVIAFAALIIGRDGTPLVVSSRVGLGALVFVAGRLALVICHELAHGLIAESYGRPISRAGIKLALVFPYVFVDTTDAWFESRSRRILISLAGPASDLVLGGAFAIACWLVAPGGLRDVFFQVALGGYIGALFNLNPLMERDGYQALVDVLQSPGLRRRASRRLQQILSGRGHGTSDRRLLAYAIASLVWSALTVAFTVMLSLRYYHRLTTLAPTALVWTVLAAFYIVLVLPLAISLLRPLWARVVTPRPGVARP